jgi:Zn-finger nucleic acid-binding protein
MKCPACDVTLVMTDRQGIEIDYCPQCRGVWLDRGELDKIIERTSTVAPQPAPSQPPRATAQPAGEHYRPKDDHRYRDDDSRYKGDDYYRHKRKKSLLGELFDF